MKKIVLFFFGLVIIAIFKPPTIYAQGCLAHDSLELVKLYKATNGVQWYESWDLTKPVETWEGVELTKDGCSVTEIYLLYNNLSESLPNLHFPELWWLNLRGNQLSGPLPNFDLPHLIKLNLANNQLTGTIPDFNLSRLEQLHLENNQLTGSMPGFESLELINEVDLENNQLSGSIPDFSSSSGVAMADVRRNHFTFQSLPPRKDIQVFFFDPQKPILIHKGKGNTIYVQAGGDLKKNTYTWYKDSAVYKTVVEDSALVVTEPGSYYCRITRQFGDFYHSNYPNYRPFFVNLQSHSISIGLIPTIELLQEPLFTQTIENKEEKSGAILFPNPAKSRVSINIQGAEEKPVTIQVFDPLGTLRLSRSINQLTNTTAFLNVGSLSAGHYYVRIQVEGKPLATKQLLISH